MSNKKTILIVDDAAFIRMMIKDAVKNSFEVVGEGKSGEEAVELWKSHRPDITTMDISLTTDSTGIDALKQIKRIDPDAKVVMVSSMGEQEYIKRSIDLGASDFIVKPFTKEGLLSALESALG